MLSRLHKLHLEVEATRFIMRSVGFTWLIVINFCCLLILSGQLPEGRRGGVESNARLCSVTAASTCNLLLMHVDIFLPIALE